MNMKQNEKFEITLSHGSYIIEEVKLEEYQNNNTALILETEEGSIVASVNAGVPLPKPFVAIKNYSEFVGIDQELIKANIIEPEVLMTIPINFVEVPVYLLVRD